MFPETAMKKDTPTTPTANKNVLPNATTPVVESGYERVSTFRQKLATDDLKRYEVYVSSTTRQGIKDIAALEGISAGVAGEALLKLGIESYHKQSASFLPSAAAVPAAQASALRSIQASVASAQTVGALSGSAPFAALPFGPLNAASQSLDGSNAIGKGLALYTDRSETRVSALSKQSVSQVSSVAHNLIASAKRNTPKT
jgi:hypothetical protein